MRDGRDVVVEQRHRMPVTRSVATRLLSDGSLTKKASLNVFAYAVDHVARIAVKVAITPFLLTRLGDTLFGIWTVLRGLIDQSAPASGRPGEALKWTVAHDQASSDVQEKRRHVGNAVAVWLLFLPIMVMTGGLLAWFAPLWVDVDPSRHTLVRLAGGVLVLDLVLASLVYLPQAVLQGENLGYKRLGLSTVIVFTGGVLMWAAVSLGAGLLGLAVAVLLQTALAGVTYLHIARTRVPWFGIVRPERGRIRAFAGLSWWFLLWNLVMRAMQASDVVLLGIAGSPALVTTYAVAKYVPQAATVAAAMMIFSIMPGLGGLVGRGDLERTARIRRETMTLTWLATLAAGVTIVLWQASFLDLWVGPRYYPGRDAMLAIVVMVLQFALIRTDANIIDLTLSIGRKVLLGLLSAVLSLGIAWYLVAVRDLGIVGLAAGLVLGRVVLSVAYPAMVGRILGIPLGRHVLGILRPAALTIALLVGASALGARLHAGSWIALAGAATTTGLAVMALAPFAGLGAPSRRNVWRRLRKIGRFR